MSGVKIFKLKGYSCQHSDIRIDGDDFQEISSKNVRHYFICRECSTMLSLTQVELYRDYEFDGWA